MSTKKEKSTLSVANIIHWLKSANPVIDDVQQVLAKISNSKTNRKGVTDDEVNTVKEILEAAVINMESDCPAMHGLDNYDTGEAEQPVEVASSDEERKLDNSPLIPEISEADKINLSKNDKSAIFAKLKNQLNTTIPNGGAA